MTPPALIVAQIWTPLSAQNARPLFLKMTWFALLAAPIYLKKQRSSKNHLSRFW